MRAASSSAVVAVTEPSSPTVVVEALGKPLATSIADLKQHYREAVPALYDVAGSAALREDLQEDGQASLLKQFFESPGQISEILHERFSDCQRAEEIDVLVKWTIASVQHLREKHVHFLDKASVVEAGRAEAEFAGDSASGLAGGTEREGTGFVNAGQVRAMMCQDFSSLSDSESSDEECKDDEEFERKLNLRASARGPRTSRAAVCAEDDTIPEGFTPPVFEKSDSQRKRIAEAVSGCFMFAALGPAQLNTAIAAFQEVTVNVGQHIIEEGADVGPEDHGLYVLESGRLNVLKKGNDEPVFVYDKIGQYFGDLALLYNAPRAATVVACEASTLWSIDRTTFNCLVKNEVKKAKARRCSFLRSVDILKGLSPDEIASLADTLCERQIGEGVHLIREGEEGSEFFIMEQGHAEARKGGETVLVYGPGAYFGELALLKDDPRAADVVTTETCTVMSLDRRAFDRLLGSLEQIMLDRAALYS